MSTELSDELKSGITFVSGNTHPQLGAQVARLLGLEPAPTEYRRFADTETGVRHEQSVRGAKLLIAFQTHAPVEGYSVADSFYQHLQMVDAAARSGAQRIMALAPNVAGARQDRQVKPREAVSIDLNLDLLRTAGASHFVTVDIHDPHSLNSFRKPGVADQFTAQPMLREALATLMTGDDPEGYVLVSPDEGHSKVLRTHAEALGIKLRDMVKDRDPDREVVTHRGKVHDVEGRVCFIMDDLISTGGTIASAAEKLHDSGSSSIYVAATHGWFSGQGAERLRDAPIEGIYVTDTLPISPEVRETLGDTLHVLSAAEVIARGCKQIITGGSVSGLYSNGENYY